MNFVQKSLIAGFVVGSVLFSSGCRTKGRNGGDMLDPQALPGDFGLGERFEDGTRISVAEFSVEPISFDYDSFRINSSEQIKVTKVSEFMKDKREVRLVVEGHCDERGSREYNMSLGEHRALAIRAALIGEGVDNTRIQTRSYGEEKPLDFGHSENSWRVNRRGEFALYR